MSQPPPPPGGYGQPQYGAPFGQPPKKSGGNKTLWIVLIVIGGLLLLCCGGVAAFFVWGANEVDNAIEEEEDNNTPREIELGEAFEHDDYQADEGWRVVDDGFGNFTITDLTITNGTDEDFDEYGRYAQLEFRVYSNDTLIGTIDCSTVDLAEGDSAEATCYSSDPFEDFDTIKVSDQY